MIKLEHSGQFCRINQLGFIEKWSENDTIDNSHPIYIVMFKNYSRLNPFCRQLNMNAPIDIVSLEKMSITYNKAIENFQISCSIQLKPHILWTISPITSCKNHTWGLAIPTNSNKWESIDRKISTSVSVFSAFFQEEYRDQSQLDLPIMSNSDIAVFGVPYANSQFFTYKKDDCSWIRFSCSSTSQSFLIHIKTNPQKILKIYLEEFPQAKQILENQFHEIASQYKIKIQLGKIPADDAIIAAHQYSSMPTSANELKRFHNILSKALKKYPQDIFVKLNIEQIFLVSTMHLNTETPLLKKTVTGWAYKTPQDNVYNTLVFDISRTDEYIIHHEILHCLSNRLDNFPHTMYPEAFNYDVLNVSEYLSELYASIMMSRKLPVKLDDQVLWMRNQVKDVVPYINAKSNQDNWELLDMLPKRKSLVKTESKPSKACILGSQRCGMSVLSAMLNCSCDIKLGQNLLLKVILKNDLEINLDKTQYRFVWLIRNPLENVMALTKNQFSYINALKYWCNANILIWNFLSDIDDSLQIRVLFEELLFNIAEIRNVFEFLNISFNKQFIQYGDFDQPTSNNSFFSKGSPDIEKVSFYRKDQDLIQLWNTFREQDIIRVLGFSKSIEE